MTHPQPKGQAFATPEEEVRSVGSFIMTILEFIFGAISLSLAAFFRRDFGRRYFTVITFLIGLIFMNLFSLSTEGMAVNRGGIAGVQLLPLFTTAFLIIGFYHFWKLWVNRKLNNHILSYHDGRSHLEPIAEWIAERPSNPVFRAIVDFLGRFTLTNHDRQYLNDIMMTVPSIKDTDRFAKMWLEPVFGGVLALIFAADYFVALWLALGSISLFVSSYIIIRKHREQELNVLDSRVHAEMQRKAMEVERSVDEQLKERREAKAYKPPPLPQLKLSPVDLNPDLQTVLAEIEIDLVA